ncbi:Bug family tripartite tricarboxylate transporter substrate binding protein [Achromobacter anxifer]|uniref:Bug family tripartite tricarboxylate transporter substrate binding protein n=1 Tax=Achromobacter anxifer TaxID=1287737 RepID=UPI0021572268|nr:tripartite tricarboxylate transporter substrate binding protein [Achromobacter anxifer]
MRAVIARVALCMAAASAAATAVAAGAVVERIVVPYAVGGVTDLYGRVLAERLAGTQAAPILVDNRPGGGAAIGTSYVAKSPPDGRTLLLGSVGTATNPAMIKSLPYDPRDIVPVAQVAVSPLILYVRADLATDVRQLIDYARKSPRGLSFANSGVGSSPNLAAALFARELGLQVTHVSYRGTSAAINDLLGGQVDAYFDTLQAMTHVKAGRIRALAVAAPERLELAPDLPTLDELGVRDVYASSWWGIFVPSGTPPESVQALQARLRTVVEEPIVQQRAREMGAIAVFRDQPAFQRFFDSEVTRWSAIIAAEKLSAQ